VLPDYPAIKDKLNRRLLRALKAKKKRHLGPFAQVQEVFLPEGHGTKLTREDGSEASTPFEHLEVMADLRTDPEKCSAEDVLRVMDELAEKIAEKQIKQFISVTNKAVEEVGNVVKRQPGESMIEGIFKSLDRVLIDFDAQGNPTMPTMLSGSQVVVQELSEALRQIESTPDLRQRCEAIIDRKREEWRVRESSRNLVG
jgi:hypothetical protein